MKTLRYLLISSLFTLGLFSIVTYTACNKDECKNTSCLHGGTCLAGKCTCPIGFDGVNCEIDLCESKNCYNGGMCVNGTCKCAAGYEGENCELTNKFVGRYTATYQCNQISMMPREIVITMKGNGESALKITGIGGTADNIYGSISTSGNGFIIAGKTYEEYNVNGSGTYDYNTGNIEAGYTIAYPNGTVGCSGVWVKQ